MKTVRYLHFMLSKAALEPPKIPYVWRFYQFEITKIQLEINNFDEGNDRSNVEKII